LHGKTRINIEESFAGDRVMFDQRMNGAAEALVRFA
jgi:hypothetical protein